MGDAGGPDGGLWPDAGCGEGGLYGYAAAPGYDCASGIGSVDGYNLVSAWLGAVRTSTVVVPLPAETSEGAPVTLTATVTVDGASAKPLTGDVTFTFESFNATGGLDLSWELGTVVVTDGTASGGSAELTTTVPPGLVRPGHQQVEVVAVYGGDRGHLASTSAPATLSFAPLSFAIVPPELALAPNGTETFTTSGGVPPVRWFVQVDTTVDYTGGYPQGSSIGESDGGFVAGPKAGYVEISALDRYGAEALAQITVGEPKALAPWVHPDAGVDSGALPAAPRDAGHDAPAHATPPVRDATADRPLPDDLPDTVAGSGCTCDVGKGQGPRGQASLGALAGLVFGVVGILARRRARAVR